MAPDGYSESDTHHSSGDSISRASAPPWLTPPNPSELLMKDRLEQLMEQVSSRYDYVLIDNVPIGGIADAQAAVEE